MIVPFDPIVHGAFVSSAYRMGAGVSTDDYESLLHSGAELAVEVWDRHPEVFFAFAAVLEGAVVWAYTRPKARKRRFMTGLLGHLGVDIHAPFEVMQPNHVAERMRRHGFRISYVSQREPGEENHERPAAADEG